MLKLAVEGRSGIRSLARESRIGPSTFLGLLDEMREEGLLVMKRTRSGQVGRPKTKLEVTALGERYLGAFSELQRLALRSRAHDRRRAAAGGEYAARLASKDLSTYDLFFELNEIAKSTGKITL